MKKELFLGLGVGGGGSFDSKIELANTEDATVRLRNGPVRKGGKRLEQVRVIILYTMSWLQQGKIAYCRGCAVYDCLKQFFGKLSMDEVTLQTMRSPTGKVTPK